MLLPRVSESGLLDSGRVLEEVAPKATTHRTTFKGFHQLLPESEIQHPFVGASQTEKPTLPVSRVLSDLESQEKTLTKSSSTASFKSWLHPTLPKSPSLSHFSGDSPPLSNQRLIYSTSFKFDRVPIEEDLETLNILENSPIFRLKTQEEMTNQRVLHSLPVSRESSPIDQLDPALIHTTPKESKLRDPPLKIFADQEGINDF